MPFYKLTNDAFLSYRRCLVTIVVLVLLFLELAVLTVKAALPEGCAVSHELLVVAKTVIERLLELTGILEIHFIHLETRLVTVDPRHG